MGWFGNKDDDDLKKNSNTRIQDVEEDEEEEDDEVDTYEYEYDCDNCESTVTWYIPMGTRVIDYNPREKCENCGCSLIDPEAKTQSKRKND